MKKNGKFRKLIPLLIVVFALIAIGSIIFLIYSFRGNYTNYSNVDNSAENVSDNIARDSNIIIVNGIVIGASKDGHWISTERYYDTNGTEGNIEVNLYSQTSQYGTYNTASLKKSREGVVYTTLDKATLPSQYLAVSSNVSKGLANLKSHEASAEDIQYVKQALGGYIMLNAGINITEVYTANIINNADRIICVTAEKANMLGVYSAVVYVTEGRATLIKYSHVKDIDNSDRWPVYSLKFIHDLDGNGTPEIILEEVTGNDVRYTVHELRNNIFYQVLNTSIEI